MIKKLIYVFCIIFLCKSPCLAYINSDFGIKLDKNRWGIIVREVFQNYPAIEVGLSDGDYILELNKLDATKMSFNDFCYVLNKSSHKPINLKVRRGEDILSFNIEPIDIWKVYTNKLSNDLVNSLDKEVLPQFFTSKYEVKITEKTVEPKFLALSCSDNEKDFYNDEFIKDILTKNLNKLRPLPENYDNAVFEIEFSRDGINNKVNTKLISKYKKSSFKLFGNLAQTANFIDIINSFKTRKEAKNIEMTLIYKGQIPLGEIYQDKVLSYSNLKNKKTSDIVKLLDKVSKNQKTEVKNFTNFDGKNSKLIGYSEIFVKIYPVSFNGLEFEAVYNLKQSKGFCYKYPQKSIVTPSQAVYSYYISYVELKPFIKDKIVRGETFAKSLYSYYKKSYPSVLLEKTKSEYSISKKDCFRIKGKESIIEIIPDKTDTTFIVRYYNLLDIKALNKEYYKLIED